MQDLNLFFEKYCLQSKPPTVYIHKKKFAVMQKACIEIAILLFFNNNLQKDIIANILCMLFASL